VKRGIQIAGRALKQTTLDGQPFWFTERPMPKASPSAHLLPNYDEYFIGFKDRSVIGQRLRSSKAVTGGNALMAHVVVVDGQLVGGWKRTFEKKNVVVQLELLTRLTKPEQRRVAAATRRFGEFLGSPVELRGPS